MLRRALLPGFGPVDQDVLIEPPPGGHGETLVKLVVEALQAAGIPFFLGGSTRGPFTRINVSERRRDEALGTLARLAATFEARTRYRAGDHAPRPLARIDRARQLSRSFDISVTEEVRHPHGDTVRLGSMFELELWFEQRGLVHSARPNRVISVLRPQTFDGVAAPSLDGSVRDLGSLDELPPIDEPTFPIDVVYTWVDDTDVEWEADKRRYLQEAASTSASPTVASAGDAGRALSKERFFNRDELRYSLRSLSLFAPWVRRIYIVTAGQQPAWLNLEHPKLELVDHRDIFSDPTALPVFNSSAIETQLHHIPELAEHFVYFNDDVFLGRYCAPDTFFLANGVSRFQPARHTIADFDIDTASEEHLAAAGNGIRLLQQSFGVTVHQPMAHVPHAARRSILYEMEERFAAEYARCVRNRFRAPSDITPIAFMYPHYAFMRGTATPSVVSNRYLSLWSPRIEVDLNGLVARRDVATFCINDHGVPPGREHEVDAAVRRFLERYYPFKSPFEL
jgi:hypothetical protein